MRENSVLHHHWSTNHQEIVPDPKGWRITGVYTYRTNMERQCSEGLQIRHEQRRQELLLREDGKSKSKCILLNSKREYIHTACHGENEGGPNLIFRYIKYSWSRKIQINIMDLRPAD